MNITSSARFASKSRTLTVSPVTTSGSSKSGALVPSASMVEGTAMTPLSLRSAETRISPRTSPVFTPIRAARPTPWSRSRSWFSVSNAVRIPSAARTARSASSSWSCGIPNTAITASPMNFSTVPPCRSITADISSK